MISDENLRYIIEWVKGEIGLVLEDRKRYLVDHRLGRLVEETEFDTIDEMVDAYRSGSNNDALGQKMIDALVTNETYFFRDKKPFVDFKDAVLHEITEKKRRTFKIMSLGGSTGQEAYSLAMILEDLIEKGHKISYSIVVADISEKALQIAAAGVYNHFEVQRGLTIQQIMRWFTKDGNDWVVKPELQSHIRFERFNLLGDQWPDTTFNFIFLRNVLIYFDREEKRRIIDRVADILAPDGYVLIGSTETLHYVSDTLEPIRTYSSTLYQKSGRRRTKPTIKHHKLKQKPGSGLNLIWPYADKEET